jgi:hypothetical protein
MGGLRGISPLCHGDEVDGLFPQAEKKAHRALLLSAPVAHHEGCAEEVRWQFYYCARTAYCGNDPCAISLRISVCRIVQRDMLITDACTSIEYDGDAPI